MIDIRKSDGFVFASPIYILNITGESRSFPERLMYPGSTDHELAIAEIFTMNADQEAYGKFIAPMVKILSAYFKQNFHADVPDPVLAFDTLQRNNNGLYKPGHTDHAAKAKRHETQWPIDKKNSF